MKKILTSILCMLCLFSASMSAFEYKGINYSVVSNEDQTATVAAPNTVSGDITIPKLVMDASTATAYRVVSISDNAFKDCTELTSVTFKAELTSIGSFAFANTGLTSIVIPEAITVINESTFAGCSSLTNITLPLATTSIGKSAFANSGLTSIVIPEGVTVINESTFSGCANLTSVSLPSKLGSIGNNTFKNSGITSLELTSSTVKIGSSAFEGCTGLKAVNYTYKKASIGTDAFKGCTALVDLNLVFDNSHDYVDLGLPSGTLWATCNVGAESPEDYGDYFAWGETVSKSYYDWSTYKWCNGSRNSLTKYCTSSSYGTVDNKTVLDAEDDAATANWGANWCMPTLDQIEELYNNSYTTTTWTTQNGVKGRLIKSKTNGNSIFLPAAGCLDNGFILDAGSRGVCWSRSLDSSSYYAFCLNFNSGNIDWGAYGRNYGGSVRPVLAPQE